MNAPRDLPNQCPVTGACVPPCAFCGAPGAWLHGLSWLCEGCSRAVHLDDDVAEHRRAEGDDVAAEDRAEAHRAWAGRGW